MISGYPISWLQFDHIAYDSLQSYKFILLVLVYTRAWLSRFPNHYSRFPDYYSRFPDHYSRFPDHYSRFPDHYSRFPDHYSCWSWSWSRLLRCSRYRNRSRCFELEGSASAPPPSQRQMEPLQQFPPSINSCLEKKYNNIIMSSFGIISTINYPLRRNCISVNM